MSAAARLIAELGLDTVKFDAGLKHAETSADRFGKQLSKKLANYFSGGFLVAQAMRFGYSVFNRADTIQRTAREIGKTTDEVQLLEVAATEAGMTLTDYLQRAKDGAINLEKVLARMRERRGLQLVASSDIQQLNKDKRLIEAMGRGFVDRGIGAVGSVTGGISALLGGRFKEAGLQALRALHRVTPFHLPGLDKFATQQLNPAPQPAGGIPGMGMLGFATPGVWNPAVAWQLRSNIETLRNKADAMRDGSRFSIWNPGRTDWQEGGAYVRRGAVYVEEQSEANRELKEINATVKKFETLLRSIQQSTA